MYMRRVHSTATIHHDGGVWVCVVHSVDKCASVSVWRMKSDSVELMSQTPLSTAVSFYLDIEMKASKLKFLLHTGRGNDCLLCVWGEAHSAE